MDVSRPNPDERPILPVYRGAGLFVPHLWYGNGLVNPEALYAIRTQHHLNYEQVAVLFGRKPRSHSFFRHWQAGIRQPTGPLDRLRLEVLRDYTNFLLAGYGGSIPEHLRISTAMLLGEDFDWERAAAQCSPRLAGTWRKVNALYTPEEAHAIA